MRIPKRYANNFSQRIEIERNLSHVKYRDKIIGRLISIKVLWESFHLNTPIIGEQTLNSVHHPLGLIYYHLPSLLSSFISVCFFGSRLASQ